MRLKVKDLVGTLLVLAIAIPYVGYLLNGEMPFIEDARGMAAVGLVLAIAAYVALEWDERRDTTDTAERGLAVVSVGLGVLALVLAETGAAEILLAVFMGSVLVVWAVKVTDHAGVLPLAKHPAG
jgi:hypothetical protein